MAVSRCSFRTCKRPGTVPPGAHGQLRAQGASAGVRHIVELHFALSTRIHCWIAHRRRLPAALCTHVCQTSLALVRVGNLCRRPKRVAGITDPLHTDLEPAQSDQRAWGGPERPDPCTLR